jgi:hypothetical protein
VQALLAATPVTVEPFQTHLRGFAESFALRRLRPAAAPLPQAATPPVFVAV